MFVASRLFVSIVDFVKGHKTFADVIHQVSRCYFLSVQYGGSARGSPEIMLII